MLNIVKTVDQLHHPAKQSIDKMGIARRTFFRWCDRCVEKGSRYWKTDRQVRNGCVTGSSRQSVTTSSTWPRNISSDQLGCGRCVLPMKGVISIRKPQLRKLLPSFFLNFSSIFDGVADCESTENKGYYIFIIKTI